MNQTSMECKRIIARSFSPGISVASSADTEELCRDMGFDSLLHILKPFGDKVSGRVTVRDSQSVSNSYEDFAVRFIPRVLSHQEIRVPDVSVPQSLHKPGAPQLNSLSSPTLTSPLSSPTLNAGSIRGISVSPLAASYGLSRQLFRLEDLESLVKAGINDMGNDITAERINDLYLKFFSSVLASQPLSPFESFGHPVAGIIVISSRNETPIDTLSALYKQSHDPLIPDFVDKDYLRYYVLMHDEQRDSLDKSVALFEKMKRHFGIHCHLMRVNRRNKGEEVESSISSTHNPSSKLSDDDENSLRIFVRELVVQSVIPFMERCVATWNDQIAASRRGLTGRLFSASKKYFASSTRATSSIISNAPFAQSGFFSSSSTPASPSPSPLTGSVIKGNFNTMIGSYAYLTPEAQLRKLADFAFMLRDYKLAYTTYDLLKRDFHNDKAWAYLAASQEMAAISYLMSADYLPPKARTDIIDTLLDSATYSYISRCTLPTYALRCILMAVELLCTTGSPTAASEGATKWILKALNEKLLGRLAYVTLMERMSSAFSAHQLDIPLQTVSSKVSSDSSRPASAVSSRSESDRIPMGSRRTRKAAFWMLLAAREWYDAKQYGRSMYCIKQTDYVYGTLDWTREPGRLLWRLLESNSQYVTGTQKDDEKMTVESDDVVASLESLKV